jgi:hypothetical protein
MTSPKQFQLPNLGVSNSRAQNSTTRQLFEETKLARRKSLFKLPDLKVCRVCGGRLEADSDFQQSTKVCRKCINHFAQVGAALDAHANEKARAAKLARWANKNNF